MPFQIQRNDMATMPVDAVVVTANEDLHITGGIGAAVAQAAGADLLQRACRREAPCPVGHAVATDSFALPAGMIVHVVGPVWDDPSLTDARKRQLLSQAYGSALNCAFDNGARTIALPLISAGSFGCPAEISFAFALEAIRRFLERREADVTLVVYDREAVAAAVALQGDIARFIDDRYVRDQSLQVASSYGQPSDRRRSSGFLSKVRRTKRSSTSRECAMPRGGSAEGLEDEEVPCFRGAPRRVEAPQAMPAPQAVLGGAVPSASLSQWLDGIDASFSETLLGLIDARGLTDAQVYKRANMSRQLFSRIRCDASYRPSKKTVLALCVALELSLQETSDLLARAGFALSRSSVSDLIVEFFILRGEYDIFTINEALYAFDQPLL